MREAWKDSLESEYFTATQLAHVEIGHCLDTFVIDQLFFTGLKVRKPYIGAMI
jgi:hypothetical protein